MYKYINSQLPATFNNHFKLTTDVHPCDTRQTRTRQNALPKAIQTQEIWPKIFQKYKMNRF